MNDQRKILESIVKYAAVSTLAIFLLRFGLRYFLDKEIFTASGIRILLMGISFTLIQIFKNKLSFNPLAFSTILTVYFGLVTYPLYGFPINVGGLIIFMVSTIMISIIPIAIYHPQKQRHFILRWNMLFIASFFLVLSRANSFLSTIAYDSISYLFAKELMLGFAFFGSYLAVGWIIYQYQLMNYNSQSQTKLINKEIQESNLISKKQAVELNEKKMSLKKIQHELLEAKSTLEEKVKLETANVDEKTKLLLKLSFINSHYLRLPLSRIQSVLQVWQVVGSRKRKDIITKSMIELKLVIDAIIKMSEEDMDVSKAEKYLRELLLSKKDGP